RYIAFLLTAQFTVGFDKFSIRVRSSPRWRRPMRVNARERAGPPRNSYRPRGRKAQHSFQSTGERNTGPHDGALPPPRICRRGARARSSTGLSHRHCLFHTLREIRTRPLPATFPESRHLGNTESLGFLERRRTAAPRLAKICRDDPPASCGEVALGFTSL